MAFQAGGSKGKGKGGMGMPPGFNKPVDSYGASSTSSGMPPGFNKPYGGASSGSSSSAVPDVGSFFGSNSSSSVKPYGASSGSSSAVPDVGSFFGPSSSSSAKDDFDSFLDEVVPVTAAAPVVADRNEVKKRAAPINQRKAEGLFLPYLPQDDAVAAGLGAQDGGIDASEAQEVVDHLNQQLASLLRSSPPEFWKKVAMDESLDTFIDSYLHYRRRWYDNEATRKQTAGVIVGDGDLSRRVFMLLYRMSSNKDPGGTSKQSLSAKEHAALLKDWKLLDLPKLLDICAVYDHDNHELTSQLVSNVFSAQPSFANDLAAMVPPILGKIDTMHQRCCTMINSVHKSNEVDAVKQQLTEVVEYLNDVVITLDAFVGSYPPAAFLLVSAGASRDGIGMFLPALSAIYEYMIPGLSTGFSSLSDSPSESKEVKRLKSGIAKFSWNILHACFLQKEEEGFGDFPTLGGSGEVIKPVSDPESKGALLLQAAIAMTQNLTEIDLAGTLASFAASNPGTHMGALLRRIAKRERLSEVVHELCQAGFLIMDDAQYDYFLSLLSRRQTPSTKKENKVQDEETVLLQSKISQVKDLFPDYGDGFVASCLEAYDNDPEKVISRILEDKLHPDLDSLDRNLATKPSKKAEPTRDKGKGKAIEESRKGKAIIEEPAKPKSYADAGGSSAHTSAMSQPSTDVIQGRFIRRPKQDGANFNELMDTREKSSYSATVRAGKQYEYEDEYDDSFDDLTGSFQADADVEEETENLADKTRRQSAPANTVDEAVDRRSGGGRPSLQRGGLHQFVPDQRQRQQHDAPSGRGAGQPSNRGGHFQATGQQDASSGRGGTPSSRGGHFQATGQARRQTPEGPRRPSSGPSEANQSSARVGPSPQVPPSKETVPGTSSDQPPQGAAAAGAATRGGKSQQGKRKGKGKVDPTANFYLKDGKLYSYKVTGAEASFATVEEYNASQIEEEEHIMGLGAGGNVPAAAAAGEERDSSGNVGAQVPGGRGSGMRGRGGGPPGRGRYASKSNDNHRRKDQSMKKHFAGLSGL